LLSLCHLLSSAVIAVTEFCGLISQLLPIFALQFFQSGNILPKH
jgi:hypothetical protein